jgi:hypothetical protein
MLTHKIELEDKNNGTRAVISGAMGVKIADGVAIVYSNNKTDAVKYAQTALTFFGKFLKVYDEQWECDFFECHIPFEFVKGLELEQEYE